MRDELFSVVPPSPEAAQVGTASSSHLSTQPIDASTQQVDKLVGSRSQSSGQTIASSQSAIWTIPLQVSINLGSPLFGTTTSQQIQIAPVPHQSPQDDAELQSAIAELQRARTRTYFDSAKDARDSDQYYASIKPGELDADAMFKQLSKLLKNTHSNSPSYSPKDHVYPWVDLHPDLKLRSIYSGKTFDAEEFIREDSRIARERTTRMQELIRRESGMTPERLQEEIDLLEAASPFNCEHVVPQSWFKKKAPMRGDLHHLFACESSCNSFRSNIPYFDFSDFEEAVRTACGKRDGNKFEPSSGKGVVARATLYFFMRYPGQVSDPQEFPADRITTLLNWHGDHGVTEYEQHRNQAIFEKQGNRNPLIDHPDWAAKIRFSLGLA